MFICIEGIDGSGKTCVSRYISEKLGFIYQAQRVLGEYLGLEDDEYLSACKSYREKVGGSCNELFWFYATNCLLNCIQDSDIICDRHLTTLYFWYGNKENRCISEAVYRLSKKPDLTVILDVTLANAKNRVVERFSKMNSNSDYDIDREVAKASEADAFVKKAVDYCEYFGLDYKIVDTNNQSYIEVAEQIIGFIKEMY